MSTITKIGEGKRNNRLSIYLDDVFFCYLNKFTVFKYKLQEGQNIDVDKLKDIQFNNEQDSAFDLAIKYLSKYVKTEKELKDYLISKGYLPELVDVVVQKVKDYRYINDEIYVENYIRDASSKYGINKIKMMLSQKGISNELIKNIEFETDFDIIRNMANKYMHNKDLSKENIQKCAKFLYSRGFDWENISHIIDELKEKSYENRE